MRILLILITFTLSLPATHAAIPDTSYTHVTKHHKPLYEKGKGTVGFICGLVLGPIGWLGVHTFSHNLKQRQKAKDGMILLGCIVFVAGFILLNATTHSSGSAPDFHYYKQSEDEPHRKHTAANNALPIQKTTSSAKPIVAPPPSYIR